MSYREEIEGSMLRQKVMNFIRSTAHIEYVEKQT